MRILLFAVLIAIAASSVKADDAVGIVERMNVTYCTNLTDTSPPALDVQVSPSTIVGSGALQIITQASDPESGLWNGCPNGTDDRSRCAMGCSLIVLTPQGALADSSNAFNQIKGGIDRQTCAGNVTILEGVPFNVSGEYSINVTVYNGDNSDNALPYCSHLSTTKLVKFRYESTFVRCDPVWNCPEWESINCTDNSKMRECVSSNCGAVYTKAETQLCRTITEENTTVNPAPAPTPATTTSSGGGGGGSGGSSGGYVPPAPTAAASNASMNSTADVAQNASATVEPQGESNRVDESSLSGNATGASDALANESLTGTNSPEKDAVKFGLLLLVVVALLGAGMYAVTKLKRKK